MTHTSCASCDVSTAWPAFLCLVLAVPGIVLAQPACPPATLQTTASANLVPSASSFQVLLRQDDGSFTAYEITNAAPYQVLSTVRNFQRQLRTCSMITATPKGSGLAGLFARLPSGQYLLVNESNAFASAVENINATVFDRNFLQLSTSQYVIPVGNGLQEGVTPLLVTDLNHDGNPDLVIEQCLHAESPFVGCNLGVMLGTGGSGFQPPVFYPISSYYITAIAAADINVDGNLDLIVSATGDLTGLTPNKVSVFLGKGDGSFQPERVALSGPYVAALAVADLNHDGKPDLAFSTAQFGSNAVTLSISLGGGDGTFATPVGYSVVAYGGNAVAIGDLDGDGNPDVVVSGLSILFGDGKGGFPRRRDYAAGNSSSIVLTDFDGDGIPDIVIAAGNPQILYAPPFVGSIEVLFGKGNGEFAAPPLSLIPGPNDATSTPSAIAAADFDGDGILDLVAAQLTGISLLKGLGDGTFALTQQYPTTGTFVTQFAIADFNGDGKLDFAAVEGYPNGNLFVFLGNGDGTFRAPLGTTVAANATSLAAGDFNADGIPDLAVVAGPYEGASGNSLQILLGNGDGTFRPGIPYTAGPGASAVVAADFNGDGKLDLAVANTGVVELGPCCTITNGNVTILLGKGDGTFSKATVLPMLPVYSPNSLVAADFNQDGRIDLAIAQGDNNGTLATSTILVVLGHGDGTFGPAATYPVTSSGLFAVDFNGDHIPDLIASGGFLIGNGDGTFQPEVSVDLGVPAAAAGDFNRDGKLDFATLSGVGVITLLNVSGTQAPLFVVSAASFKNGPVAPESLATAFGADLASATASAGNGGLPLSLAETSVFIQDSTGVVRGAPLLYVSPQQVNFLVPSGTSAGLATVTVWNGAVPHSGRPAIATIAPSLFTLNSGGLAAAYFVRVSADGRQTFEPVFTLQNGSVAALPVDLGPPGEQVYLILYGTGIRNAGTSGTSATINGLAAQVTYAGLQPDFPGLDQVNVLLPRDLAGSGDVTVVLAAAGAPANAVHISIK